MIGRLLDLTDLSLGLCEVCGGEVRERDQGFLCGECLKAIRPTSVSVLRKLPDTVEGAKVFGTYGGVLKEAIKLIKFRRVKPLARTLGEVISSDLREYIGRVSPDIVTFVPVHTVRTWFRGFDQNEEILRGAGVRFENVLVRIRYSKPLARLSRTDRAKAVRGAFALRKGWTDRVSGKRVLVFDDVITTGSTAISVAEILLGAGAGSVFFYFLASED